MFFGRAVGRILAWNAPVDMRKSFDTLIALTRGLLQEDPLSGTLFVFINRRQTHLKMLMWDRTGFVVVAKRLERGKFSFCGEEGKREICDKELELLMDGVLRERKCMHAPQPYANQDA